MKHRFLVALAMAFASAFASLPQQASAQADEQFIGQILWVAFDVVPKGWAPCDGRTLPISQNQALFTLIGTTYGGNGQTTFALPDLRGRAPVSFGQGPGLTDRPLAAPGGEERHTLTVNELPAHTHSLRAVNAAGTVASPNGAHLATPALPLTRSSSAKNYSSAAATTSLAADSIITAGGGQPHNNMQPYVTLNCIIALTGLFPPQN
jgi:microcystin-dependent protein